MGDSAPNVSTTWPQKLGLFLFGSALCLILLEVIFQILPVASSTDIQPVSAAQPIAHSRPNQDFTFSLGWDLIYVNKGHINNLGFVNNQDYFEEGPRPLVAVIGDSYVEALMVPADKTLQGTLARAVGSGGRVYSFGMGGAPLSQYLAYAEFVRQEFHPEGMIFVVVGNDFDESHERYRPNPSRQFHRFEDTPEGGLELVRYDFERTPFKRLLAKSAFLRYLYINLRFGGTVEDIKVCLSGLFSSEEKAKEVNGGKGKKTKKEQFVGNTAAYAGPERVQVSLKVIDRFFELLPEKTGLVSNKVVFVVDGIRGEIYDGEKDSGHESYFGQMRAYFMHRAHRLGYEVVDLHPYFASKYKRFKTKFEFPRDWHWNGYGHQTAAEAVMQTKTWGHLFPAAHLGTNE